MVGVQRGLLILMAAGAVALGPSAPKTSGASSEDGRRDTRPGVISGQPEGVLPRRGDGVGPSARPQGDDRRLDERRRRAEADRRVLPHRRPRPAARHGPASRRRGRSAVRFTVATWDGHYYTNLILNSSGAAEPRQHGDRPDDRDGPLQVHLREGPPELRQHAAGDALHGREPGDLGDPREELLRQRDVRTSSRRPAPPRRTGT